MRPRAGRLETGREVIDVLARSANPLDADDSRPARFSPREVEILRLIARDLSDKEIARRLGISIHTLRTHLGRVYLRHGVHSRAAAVAIWLAGDTQIAAPA